MTTVAFGITFDYRCPFARNANEHVVTALRAGAAWEVEFLPLSLSQPKGESDTPATWDDPASDTGLLALQLGVAVRDTQPERFPDAHLALFAVRHDEGRSLTDEAELRRALDKVGVDTDAAFSEVASGRALATVRAEHERGVAEHGVWGVPTFVSGGQAAFVRLMNRAEGRPEESMQAIDRIIDLLVGWPDLNEFKHTTIPR